MFELPDSEKLISPRHQRDPEDIREFKPIVNSSKLEVLKKYPRVFPMLSLSKVTSNPMLVPRVAFLLKIEQILDRQVDQLRRVKTLEGVDLPGCVIAYFKEKSGEKATVLTQNLIDFVYSADKYGDLPSVAFFLSNLVDNNDQHRFLFLLFLRQQVKVQANVSFISHKKSEKDPNTISIGFQLFEQALKSAFEFDELACIAIMRKFKESFSKSSGVPYLDGLYVLAQLKLPFKQHHYLQRIIELYRIDKPLSAKSKPKEQRKFQVVGPGFDDMREEEAEYENEETEPVQQSVTAGILKAQKEKSTPRKIVSIKEAQTETSPGQLELNFSGVSPDFVKPELQEPEISEKGSAHDSSLSELKVQRELLAECRQLANAKVANFVEENELLDESFLQLNQICMTQLLHKYISLIKAVIKAEEAKFFLILRHKSAEGPKDRAFWAELSSRYARLVSRPSSREDLVQFLALITSYPELERNESFFLRFQYGLPPKEHQSIQKM